MVGYSDATFYHIQVSSDTLFVRIAAEDSMLAVQYLFGRDLKTGTTYYWRGRAKNDFGWGAFSGIRSFSTAGPPSAVERLQVEIPAEFTLRQNYPNPFNPSTMIEFGVPNAGFVTLKIFDLLGREIATLVSEELNPGYYRSVWRANVPSGVYFYRIQAGDFSQTKRLILLK